MPVLDNALEAGILAFVPLHVRGPVRAVDGQRPATAHPADPARAGAVLGRDRARHPATSGADSVAAILHGVFFGRVAPSSRSAVRSRPRPWSSVTRATRSTRSRMRRCSPASCRTPSSCVPRASSSGGCGPTGWTPRPPGSPSPAGRPGGANAVPGPRAFRPARHNGRVPLYRDEAIVLRTHKLGEADRIITLLTRQHGRVRAVAKGVRRTTSRFGSRLEPFTHVDLQLAEGRNLDVITQAETIEPFPAHLGDRLRPLHGRHRDARDRRPAGRRGEAARRSSSSCSSSAACGR